MDFNKAKQTVKDAQKSLKEGQLPSNEQMTEGLDQLKSGTALRSEVELSHTGQQVSEKADKAISSAKKMINETNKDDCIQKLVYYTNKTAKNLDVETPDFTNEKQKIVANTEKVYDNLIYLTRVLVTSNEFRGLLNDLFNIAKDLLQKHDFPGSEYLDDAKKTNTAKPNNNNSQDFKNDAKNIASNIAKDVKPIVDDASKKDFQSAEDKAKNKAQNAKDKAENEFEKAKNQTQEKVDEIRKKSKRVYDDLELNENQKNHLMSRVDSIIERAQTNNELKQAIKSIFTVADLISDSILSAKHQVENNVNKEIENNQDLHKAIKSAKLAVENFAGNKSLDKLMEKINDLIKNIENDSEIKSKWKSLKEFVTKSINNPEYLKDENHYEEGSNKITDIRKTVLNKHQKSINAVFNEMEEINEAIQENPTTNTFIRDLESLTKELFLDENGKPTIKYDLLNDFTKFIPVISKKLDNIALPRFEESNDDYDYIFDNVTLNCRNVVPKQCRIRTDSVFDTEEEKMANVVHIRMNKIQAQLNDATFYYKKKTGLIKMDDAGLISVNIADNGMDLFIKLTPPVVSSETIGTESHAAFKVVHVKCRVNDINVELKHTNHDMLYSLFSRIVHSKVKANIERKVEQAVQELLTNADSIISENLKNTV